MKFDLFQTISFASFVDAIALDDIREVVAAIHADIGVPNDDLMYLYFTEHQMESWHYKTNVYRYAQMQGYTEFAIAQLASMGYIGVAPELKAA